MAFQKARPQTIVVRAPAAPAPVARRSNSGALRRRYEDVIRGMRTRAVKAASEEKHTITALIAAGGFGLAERYAPETMQKLSIGPLNPEGTIGVGLWAANRFGLMRSKTMEHAATGLLSVQVYKWASGAEVSGGDDFGAFDDVLGADEF